MSRCNLKCNSTTKVCGKVKGGRRNKIEPLFRTLTKRHTVEYAQFGNVFVDLCKQINYNWIKALNLWALKHQNNYKQKRMFVLQLE